MRSSAPVRRPVTYLSIFISAAFALLIPLCEPLLAQEIGHLGEPSDVDLLTRRLEQEQFLNTLTPAWLDLRVEHRTRYEAYNHSFRNGEAGGNDQIHQRTRIYVSVTDILDPLQLTVEMADFRAPVSDLGQGSNPLFVDHLDVFQLHGDLAASDFLGTGVQFKLEVGRLVMDYGKGRLVAGHRFGSFTPSFDGVQLHLGSPDSWLLRGFATRPVQRHSTSPDESLATYFWGVDVLTSAASFLQTELYYFGLTERGRLNRRELSTLGFRLFTDPNPGHLDYEIESMYQFGQVANLDRFAHRHHSEIGYSFQVPWQPRLVLLFDYASGDSDPTDGQSGTFDFLFAKRRVEFGPTGILGAIFPSNILSPAGFRLTAAPGSGLSLMLSHRAYWLAQSRDFFAGSGLRDPTGQAGPFLGNQFEVRLGWKPTTTAWHHLGYEIGYSRFFKGSYFGQVPGSPGTTNVNYFYSMATTSF